MTERQIRRSQNQAQSAIADLLTVAFSGELLRPSKRLTLVSPYMSDFPVLDNGPEVSVRSTQLGQPR